MDLPAQHRRLGRPETLSVESYVKSPEQVATQLQRVGPLQRLQPWLALLQARLPSGARQQLHLDRVDALLGHRLGVELSIAPVG